MGQRPHTYFLLRITVSQAPGGWKGVGGDEVRKEPCVLYLTWGWVAHLCLQNEFAWSFYCSNARGTLQRGYQDLCEVKGPVASQKVVF